MVEGMRRWGLVLLLAAIAGGLVWGGWRALRMRRYRTALVEIRAQIQAGRHGAAVRNLAALLSWEPGSDEAAYLLGLCEKTRGQNEAAAAAWARVPAHSSFAIPATLGRAVLESDRGRLANAEQVLTRALRDPEIDGLDLCRGGSPRWPAPARPDHPREPAPPCAPGTCGPPRRRAEEVPSPCAIRKRTSSMAASVEDSAR